MSKLVTGVGLLLCGCGASASGAPSEFGKAENTGGQSGSGTEATGDAGSGGSSSGSTGNGGATNTDAGGFVAMGGSNTGGAGTSVTSSSLVVAVSPKATAVVVGHSLQLSATVTGSLDTVVVWSLMESSGCGGVSVSGSYTAPATVPNPAFCHVKATSHADAGKSDATTLNIVASSSTGEVGVWEDVTPAGVSLDPNFNPATNFGVMDVVADPVRPSDLYVGICYQGFWRSTDFGLTWKKVSTGTNGAVLETGRPWTTAIDTDQGRDPATAPALYTTDGYGSKSSVIFKSTDWGVNWTSYAVPAGDLYSLNMDPYDNKHLISGLHEDPALAESTDAGATWQKLAGPGGISVYPFFIDTGVPATTRKTWLLVPQQDSGTSAMTTDGGKTFKAVGGFSHPHGGDQLFNAGAGVAFVGASGGAWRTQDSGSTWESVYAQNDYAWSSGVVGSKDFLYSWVGGASSEGITDPHIYKAPRSPGNNWTAMTYPSAMNNGGKTAAVTYDGTHYIVVSGNWNAGIWRYVQP